MDPTDTAVTIAHVIQLAVAPVFLLTGTASLLSVLTGRLARIVDLARKLELELDHSDEVQSEPVYRLLDQQALRARMILRAIILCIASAILIASVVVLLFVSSLTGVKLGGVVATLFIATMVALITSLLFFLREIYLATQQLRIGRPEGSLRRAPVIGRR